MQGSVECRLADPPLRSQASMATAAPVGAGFVAAVRAALLTADSLVAAASGVPVALAAGVVPTAPQAVLVAAAPPLLLLLPTTAVAATPARALPLLSSSSPRRSGA